MSKSSNDCVNPHDPRADVIVGPCCCGGYGICLDEAHAEKEGRCHIPLEEAIERGSS